MADSSTKELTLQQKIWMYTAMAFRALWPLALYALLPSFCMAVGYVFGHPDMTMEEFFSYGANFYSALGIFLALFIFHRKAKKKGTTLSQDATLFFREMKPLNAVCFFIFGFASATAVSALLTLLPKFFLTVGYHNASQKMYLGRDLIFTMLTILFTAPVTEEIVFRGYMLNTFLEKLPEKWAVLLSSIIFALLHGSILWILYAFLLGQIMAKVSMKEDNIAYGVMLHIGFNATAIVNLFITENEKLNAALYGSKILIACYGILGLSVSVLLAMIYTEKINIALKVRTK
jgi:membrane protease YdiL (CAAX protease family)